MTSNATSLGSHLTDSGQLPEPEMRRAIEFELEAICSDHQFRSSQRNCAFIRYVVTETLAGRAADLKERTLGSALFGRPITYETGTDAVVRVRANEVRKRLSSYYETNESRLGWRIQMPLRGYAPRFLPEPQVLAAEDAETSPVKVEDRSKAQQDHGLPLSLMVMPTLVALFLCAATFRWQIFAGTPYLDFWNSLLAGRSEITFILDPDSADQHAVALDNLKAINPLVQTAVAFHAAEQVQSSAQAIPDRARTVPVHLTQRGLPDGKPLPNDAHAAYITVYPGRQPELWISSSSTAASELAIRSITDAAAFPYALELAMRRRTPSQIRIAEKEQIAIRSLAIRDQQP